MESLMVVGVHALISFSFYQNFTLSRLGQFSMVIVPEGGSQVVQNLNRGGAYRNESLPISYVIHPFPTSLHLSLPN